MTDDRLFEPKETEVRRCTHPQCLTTRKNLCWHDAQIEHGLISNTRRRPKTCLNSYDPRKAAIPY